ncbi:Efflux pump membrane transporter BepE [Neochlamydia sp. AcF65]|uniref:efflux RND transporter permease subunit n=1 Tax=Neochlamydia sp. AcF65 TaxID=2795735 RepID=UPI001BC8DF4E|nr:multidrug efflux RND transporter permease subunit [Neochlamydia sp. AcF65]MBS4166073.1 Efflux pump membrane transporter BepE [Neochlamydia sp. AcF65]
MKISNFFIDRPIFASVLSIIIMFAGFIALMNLPIEQYPNITPPLIQVSTYYPGAGAQTIADSVAAPLEQQINGVENMIYMSSQNSSSGNYLLNVYFEVGSDPKKAQIDVNNNVSKVLAQLPEEVQRQGVIVQKQTPNILLFVALQSPDGRYNDIFMSNYATINVVTELQLIPGVSQVSIIGARDYAMRIWLKPDRMAQLGITTSDVVDSIREQNSQVPAGMIGGNPTSLPIELTLPMLATGRLTTAEEFENIIIKANADGSMVFVRDIAEVELGAANYDVNAKLNNKSMTAIAIYQQYGANALEVADKVKTKMKELATRFPNGIEYTIPYDTTKFVKASIHEVAITILEAAILVVLVVLLFLQNLRATLIPMLAMLVSIVGAFAGMLVLGYSINTLTLFAMVLAIGIVVDDAIVVIENVEHNMRALKLSAPEAAKKAMAEVSGPVIAIVFVLCAVFIPVAFLGGITGELYRQFAITISIAVVISGVVALTLSPALAALLLKHKKEDSKFTIRFNHAFERLGNRYVKIARLLLMNPLWALSIFVIVCSAVGFMYKLVPSSFIPIEDQGYIMAVGMLPDGASLHRVDAVTSQIDNLAKTHPAVTDVVALDGFGLLDGLNRNNQSSYFIVFKDWSKRTGKNQAAPALLQQLAPKYAALQEAVVIPFNPPAIQGIGSVGGFEFWVQSRSSGNIESLEKYAKEIVAKANQSPVLRGVSTNIDATAKQFFLSYDREKSKSMAVSIAEVYQTLQAMMGSLYVNNFNKFGRVYNVYVQAEDIYRSTPYKLGEIYVRSLNASMVPLKSLINIRNIKGPSLISRFNSFNAARINGSAAAGFSSGQAMAAMEEIAREILPPEMSFSWGGQSYQEKKMVGTGLKVMAAGLFMVFLILAALYEKWSLPFSILMVVPFGLLGAFLAVWMNGMSNDVYFQVGLITLIALSAKNAILIVEFAVIKHQEGLPLAEAALEAGKLRLRAIMMTSLTFILGVVPLFMAKGAGAASRNSVGTGVLGGMITATFLAIFFVPFFYKLLEEIANWRGKKAGYPSIQTSKETSDKTNV